MDIAKIPLLSAMAQRLQWLGQRQQILAHNVSNIDTPGYRPMDLKKQDFGQMVDRAMAHAAVPETTNPAHLAGIRGAGANAAERQRKVAETTLSGNGVSLEEQLMKVSETESDYQLTLNLYTKQVSLIRQALGRDR